MGIPTPLPKQARTTGVPVGAVVQDPERKRRASLPHGRRSKYLRRLCRPRHTGACQRCLSCSIPFGHLSRRTETNAQSSPYMAECAVVKRLKKWVFNFCNRCNGYKTPLFCCIYGRFFFARLRGFYNGVLNFCTPL